MTSPPDTRPSPAFGKTRIGPLKWWERDEDHGLNIYGPPQPVGHDTCRVHRKYWLTCRQYEQLLRRAGGKCEICGSPDYRNTFGRLYIDHDYSWGDWAVRGLLCYRCNGSLDYPCMADLRPDYLANAWYLGMLAERGVPLAVPAEPDLLAVTVDIAGRRRIRRNDGWNSLGGSYWRNRRGPWTWTGLVLDVGPHNIRVVDDGSVARNHPTAHKQMKIRGPR
jgi:hypothetical protein